MFWNAAITEHFCKFSKVRFMVIQSTGPPISKITQSLHILLLPSCQNYQTWKEFNYNHLGCFTFFFPIIFISWRLITLWYCSGFCHMLTWISHGFTCVPHPEPPSLLPPHPIPLGHPSAPAPSTHLMHPTWTGDLFHTW